MTNSRNSKGAWTVSLGLCVFLAILVAACSGESGTNGGSTATVTSGGTTQASADTWAYELPGEQVYPEGVVYQQSSGDFFVGSTQNGAIFRGSVEEGGGEAEVFLEGGQDDRTSAIGLALDSEGALFVAGGDTGRMFVYESESGDLVDSFQNDRQETFVNDVAVAPSGDAYFTDSFSPVLYRLSAEENGYQFEEWLDLTDTPIEYQDGFNLNGIVAANAGKYLIVTHSSTGQLFRIDTESKEVIEIQLGGDQVPGDGLILDRQTLYAVTGEEISRVQLSGGFTRGTVENTFSHPSFKSPTTIDKYDERLLVVNSQFDARESGNPELPFTVADVPIP